MTEQLTKTKFELSQRSKKLRILKAGKYFDANNADVYTMDINLYSCQQEILDKPEAERTVRGYTRNLAAAATGTGKFGLCRGGGALC